VRAGSCEARPDLAARARAAKLRDTAPSMSRPSRVDEPPEPPAKRARMRPMSAAHGRLVAWAGPCLVAAAGAALLAWTWRAWPDPVVDFGRELYVAWRLAEGDLLYRDVAWFNGPLSAYTNAFAFRLFGPGLMTLAGVNLVLLAGLTAMLYRLIVRLADRLAACAACLVLLAVFGFGQYVGIANYNWVAPYSHELTHGLFLAFAALSALAAWRDTRRGAWLLLAGLALGLSFLTKVETFVAAAAASAVALAWPRPGGRALAGFAGAALLPPLAAFALLASALAPGEALRATLGAWPWLLDGEVSRLPFYRIGMGVDRPAARLAEMLRWSGGWLLALGPALALACVGRGARALGARLAAFAAVAEIAALAFAGARVDWLAALRPLPLFTLGAAAALAVAARRRPGGRAPLALAFAALAFAMLGKMLLHARVSHYGFALAMPATLLAVVAVVGWLPAWLDRIGAHGVVLRAAALAVLAFASLAHLRETERWLERKTAWVGAGRDAFRADPRGQLVSRAVAHLEAARVRSLVALPEGVMLNYLARIPNPTPYVNFVPPELLFFGEPAWLAALEAHPPEAIALVHKDTSEYGYRFFGRDYAREVARWVESGYRASASFGQEPLQPGSGFGIRIVVRDAGDSGAPQQGVTPPRASAEP
jgi:hypothetical protein